MLLALFGLHSKLIKIAQCTDHLRPGTPGDIPARARECVGLACWIIGLRFHDPNVNLIAICVHGRFYCWQRSLVEDVFVDGCASTNNGRRARGKAFRRIATGERRSAGQSERQQICREIRCRGLLLHLNFELTIFHVDGIYATAKHIIAIRAPICNRLRFK